MNVQGCILPTLENGSFGSWNYLVKRIRITAAIASQLVDSAYLLNSLQSWKEKSESSRSKMMATTEGYVTTQDSVRLFFRKLGSGSKAVMIPNATYMFDDFKYLAEEHTVITYDLRNRGRSDAVTDASKLERGIHNDVEDLEAVRAHFNADAIDLIGHSYLGMVVALYAMKYPNRVGRIVQIGAVQPIVGKKYDAHLTGADATMAEVYAKMGELQKQ